MFGNRKKTLAFFELCIPEKLYLDWQRCFAFHKLALDYVRSGNPPVWLEDKRVRAVAASSIAKTTVEMESGEMSYSIFDYSENLTGLLENKSAYEKLNLLNSVLGDSVLPSHLINFIQSFSPDGIQSLAVHEPTDISGRGIDTDKENISRPRGLIGAPEMEKARYPHAIHHIKIFYNRETSKARVFYRFIGSIKFLRRRGR